MRLGRHVLFSQRMRREAEALRLPGRVAVRTLFRPVIVAARPWLPKRCQPLQCAEEHPPVGTAR
jgi:hypothetical protein